MPGQNQQTTNSTQSSVSSPWDAAQPMLKNLIASYSGGNTALTPEQTAAMGQLTKDTTGIPNQGAGAAGAVNNALNFSTAPQMGMLGDAYKTLQTNLNPTASGAYLDPRNTPGFADAMSTMGSDITKQVGNQYAASGRAPSGSGSQPQTLARGLSQGQGGLIANQYNQNVANMMGANSQLFSGGNTTATGQAGLKSLEANTKLAGSSAIPGVSAAYAAPGTTSLAAANAAYQQPWSNLAALLGPAATLGSMGGQTYGTGTSTTTQPQNTMSNIMGGISSGLGILSFAMSDIRAKENITPIGKTFDGQTIHRYRMKGQPKMQIGLLAQEVAARKPSAVRKMPGGMGMLGVNYEAATDDSARMAA